VSGAGDHRVKIWKFSSSSNWNCVKTLKFTFDIRALCVVGDRLIIGEYSNSIYEYDIRNWEQTRSVDDVRGPIFDFVLFENRLYLASWNYSVEVYDAQTLTKVGMFEGHTSMLNSLTLDSDHKMLFSAGADKTIIQWNITKSAKEFEMKGHSGAIHSLLYLSKENVLVSVSEDGTVGIWSEGKCVQSVSLGFVAKKIIELHSNALLVVGELF